jgi:hypothetical protein
VCPFSGPQHFNFASLPLVRSQSHPLSCLPGVNDRFSLAVQFSALKTQVARSSKMLLTIYQTTRRQIPDENNLMILKLLTFWNYSSPYFIYLTLCFGNWTLPPLSGKKSTSLGPIDRACPHLRNVRREGLALSIFPDWVRRQGLALLIGPHWVRFWPEDGGRVHFPKHSLR